MNKVKGVLPMIAFVFAAFAAFAFAPAQTSEYAFDGEEWINVTNMTPDDDYRCVQSDEVCTRTAPNQSAPEVKPGLFELIED